MPELAEMEQICRRLVAALDAGPLDRHRLREMETITRLLVPHLSRAVADAVQQGGPLPTFQAAGKALMDMEQCLVWIELHRNTADDADMQSRLREGVYDARRVVRGLDGEREG